MSSSTIIEKAMNIICFFSDVDLTVEELVAWMKVLFNVSKGESMKALFELYEQKAIEFSLTPPSWRRKKH